MVPCSAVYFKRSIDRCRYIAVCNFESNSSSLFQKPVVAVNSRENSRVAGESIVVAGHKDKKETIARVARNNV
jgi:hypothetical protein